MNTDKAIADVKVGKNLEEHIHSKKWFVRMVVANQGYGLEQLINDENWAVREAVAKQGYGLAQLINDKVAYVRIAAREQLKTRRGLCTSQD